VDPDWNSLPGETTEKDSVPIGGSAEHSESVMRLYSQHQRWLFVYLTTLVGSVDDAEDLMQEVCVVMWQQHQRFELGTNFAAWLSVIAYHQVQKFWRKQKQQRRFVNPEIVEQLAEQVPKDRELLDRKRQLLRDCVGGLKLADQQLLSAIYGESAVTIRQLSKELSQPERRMYKTVARIRRRLFECVRKKMRADGWEVVP
jgi:RNA polymerase sigma-70 factor, ECF subfamily